MCMTKDTVTNGHGTTMKCHHTTHECPIDRILPATVEFSPRDRRCTSGMENTQTPPWILRRRYKPHRGSRGTFDFYRTITHHRYTAPHPHRSPRTDRKRNILWND